MSGFQASSTALVLIDLQKGILSGQLAPYTGDEVLARAKSLSNRFRDVGAPVVLVRVAWSSDGADILKQPVDRPNVRSGPRAPDFTEYGDGLRRDGDILITKRNWGAFYGTELDLQLRRRSIGCVIIGGIATNFGVESTARAAWELNYDVCVLRDVTSSASTELHDFSIGQVMPRIARVISSDAVVFT